MPPAQIRLNLVGVNQRRDAIPLTLTAIVFKTHVIGKESLVELQPSTLCVVGSIPAGSTLKVWPWTLVLNRLVG